MLENPDEFYDKLGWNKNKKDYSKAKEVWVRMGGLMEDPELHWEYLGMGYGDNDREIILDYFKVNPDNTFDPKSLTLWGWRLETRKCEHRETQWDNHGDKWCLKCAKHLEYNPKMMS